MTGIHDLPFARSCNPDFQFKSGEATQKYVELPQPPTFVLRELVPQGPQQWHTRGVGVAEQGVHVGQQRVS